MSSALTLGKSRIEALTDGVFAIAMTLLVLKLEVPAVMHHASNEAMLRELLAMTPEFIAYVVTFLIAGGFWFLHHLTFHFIRGVNGFLLWVNLTFLMLISLLPFSAGLLSHLLVHPVSQLFYFGNQLAIALMLNLHWICARATGLTDASARRDIEVLTIRVAVTAAAFAACFVTAMFLPAYSALPLPLFLAVSAIVERIRKRRL